MGAPLPTPATTTRSDSSPASPGGTTPTSETQSAAPSALGSPKFHGGRGNLFAAVLAADATCTTAHHAEECISYGPPIASAFFDQAAHIIAVLLIGLAIEARLLVEQQGAEHREERALVTITVLGRALGIAASLTASAADAQKLPFTFPLTVEALALGLATIVQLPRLKPDKAG